MPDNALELEELRVEVRRKENRETEEGKEGEKEGEGEKDGQEIQKENDNNDNGSNNKSENQQKDGNENGVKKVVPRTDDMVRKRSRKWRTARRSLLNKSKLQRIGASLMRMMDGEMFVGTEERVMMSFRAVGESELAHPITRVFQSLAHLRVASYDQLKLKLRSLDLVTSVADGAIWRGYDQARMLLLETPTDAADLLYVFTLVEQLCDAEETKR